MLASPGGSPQSAGSPQAQGPTAEVIFGQILQQMQAGMSQMSQRVESKVRVAGGSSTGAGEQRVTAEAQFRAFEAMWWYIKGVGKPEVLKGSHEDARKVWKTWSYKFESWLLRGTAL